jgi:hypothetical protein
MGCTNPPQERDDELVAESANGQHCQPDRDLQEAVREHLQAADASLADRLGLEKADMENTKLVEDRIHEQLAREMVDDGEPVDFDLVHQCCSSLGRDVPEQLFTALGEAFRSQDLNAVSEKLGDLGADLICRARGYMPVVTAGEKQYLRGFDSLWFDPRDQKLVVVESKGQGSQPKLAYGALQGTIFWAFKSHEQMARSSRTTQAEKNAANAILKALEAGTARVELIRTTHSAGIPAEIQVEAAQEVVSFHEADGESDDQ